MGSEEIYYPSQEVLDYATVKEYDNLYKYSIENSETFWEEQAQNLEWYEPWDKVLDDSDKPFYKWFVGAKTNIIHNAIDRHLKTATRNKIAFVWEGENGDLRVYSYHALNREVSQFANILKSMGVKKGDTVTIYMPQIPEQIFAMLACAKIGAVHSVVYAGFSYEALGERIKAAKSKVVITADGGFRKGKIVDLKGIVNVALEDSPYTQVVITIKRTGHNVEMISDRDYWYHDLKSLPIASIKCNTEIMEATDPLFLLYTSGSTGKPKGLVHTHGGYSVYTYSTMKMLLDVKPEDRIWTAADPGWITGHSYIVYGPLINGATMFLYEGAPNHPYPNRWWQMIEKYGITILYTSPTAIRGLMRFGESWVKRHDISSLRLLGSVGEPINPEAWKWYYEVVGNKKCPIIDTWWQTETGGHIIAPLPVFPLKPGSATKPFFGIEVGIVDDEGNQVKPNEQGNLVIKNPWPGMACCVHEDRERWIETYWKKYEKFGWYHPGDAAKYDDDNYIWIIGRSDDVIKVSGYRLGTAEIESALVSHPAVAEAAAIALPHPLKGNAIHTYVILKKDFTVTAELENELKEQVTKLMGPIARPETITFVDALPKTRSGKIMRRVLKARAQGLDVGDISTLEE
ncbi:MAG: acetate--CoA ligase [Candidatus Kapaibacteriota bacterium]